MRALEKDTKRLLRALKRPRSSVALSLVTDRRIRSLNKEFRGKDTATDVLSFPLGDNPRDLLGDVVISLDTAKRQAKAYDAPVVNELRRLLIHGVLHLLGHDHHKREERKLMEAEERRLAKTLRLQWPYD